MKSKRILALTLAVSMIASIGLTASATAGGAVDTGIITSDSGKLDSVFTGTVAVTGLNVIVPTAIPFDVEVGGEAANLNFVAPPEVKIINNSAVPVKATISEVKADTGITLVKTDAALSAAKSMMFGLTTETAPTTVTAAVGKAANLLSLGKTPVVYAESIPATNGEAPVNLFGKSINGWGAGSVFTVTPTFTINAVIAGA